MGPEERKRIAVTFLEEAAAGRARAAKDRFVAPACKHHNAYFPAGMGALTEAMDEAAREHPDKTLDILRVIGENDLVAVHSCFKRHPDDRGFAVMHIFRFEDDKIVEFWDFGQPVPEEMPNTDGMF
ncbi:MAG: nuclear transport factor 2 family protein [Euryarchaeota archaeon]|nr:nuclear transport factor 2 family protein [Euryarchaeota archaeon]